jgi:epoxide hydrolase-like predicted phosphatase
VAERTGLVVDWGGVMTTDLFASFAAFDEREGLPADTTKLAFRTDPEARAALDDLECGRIDIPAFEVRFAPTIGAEPEDLAARLFSGMGPDETMIGAVERIRQAGIRTGLLSNSWHADMYPPDVLERLFDVLVISGEVGMRKPDPRIYALTVERMEQPADQLVFVDDIGGNLKPARAAGFHTILHTSAADTIPQLEAVLGVSVIPGSS